MRDKEDKAGAFSAWKEDIHEIAIGRSPENVRNYQRWLDKYNREQQKALEVKLEQPSTITGGTDVVSIKPIDIKRRQQTLSVLKTISSLEGMGFVGERHQEIQRGEMLGGVSKTEATEYLTYGMLQQLSPQQLQKVYEKHPDIFTIDETAKDVHRLEAERIKKEDPAMFVAAQATSFLHDPGKTIHDILTGEPERAVAETGRSLYSHGLGGADPDFLKTLQWTATETIAPDIIITAATVGTGSALVHAAKARFFLTAPKVVRTIAWGERAIAIGFTGYLGYTGYEASKRGTREFASWAGKTAVVVPVAVGSYKIGAKWATSRYLPKGYKAFISKEVKAGRITPEMGKIYKQQLKYELKLGKELGTVSTPAKRPLAWETVETFQQPGGGSAQRFIRGVTRKRSGEVFGSLSERSQAITQFKTTSHDVDVMFRQYARTSLESTYAGKKLGIDISAYGDIKPYQRVGSVVGTVGAQKQPAISSYTGKYKMMGLGESAQRHGQSSLILAHTGRTKDIGRAVDLYLEAYSQAPIKTQVKVKPILEQYITHAVAIEQQPLIMPPKTASTIYSLPAWQKVKIGVLKKVLPEAWYESAYSQTMGYSEIGGIKTISLTGKTPPSPTIFSPSLLPVASSVFVSPSPSPSPSSYISISPIIPSSYISPSKSKTVSYPVSILPSTSVKPPSVSVSPSDFPSPSISPSPSPSLSISPSPSVSPSLSVSPSPYPSKGFYMEGRREEPYFKKKKKQKKKTKGKRYRIHPVRLLRLV